MKDIFEGPEVTTEYFFMFILSYIHAVASTRGKSFYCCEDKRYSQWKKCRMDGNKQKLNVLAAQAFRQSDLYLYHTHFLWTYCKSLSHISMFYVYVWVNAGWI